MPQIFDERYGVHRPRMLKNLWAILMIATFYNVGGLNLCGMVVAHGLNTLSWNHDHK